MRARQVRTGLAQTATSGTWANCKLTSRAGMAGAVSRWLGSVEGDRLAYAYEMTDEQHRELAQVLHKLQGKVAISGYRCSLMDELYGNWQAIAAPTKVCHSTKGLRTEVLWINYDLEEVKKNPFTYTQKLAVAK